MAFALMIADINNWDFVRAFREPAWTVQRRLYPDRPFIVIAEDSQRKTIITQNQPKVVDAEWNFSFQQEMRSFIRNNIVTAQGQPARSQRVRAAIAGTGVWDGLSNTLQLALATLRKPLAT
jgi:hypothetical protein